MTKNKYDWLNLEPNKERYSKLLLWQKDIVELFNPSLFGVPENNLLKFIYSVSKKQDFSEVSSCRPYDHTMSDSIDKYVSQKLPHALIKKHIFESGKIEIHGIHPMALPEVSKFLGYKIIKNIKFTHNSSTKKFNFQRPTFSIAVNKKNENILFITTIPGRDYILHYGSLVRHYLNTLTSNHKDILSLYRYPFAERSIHYWTKLDNNLIYPDDTVIVGYVAELFTYFKKNTTWKVESEFENEFYQSLKIVTDRGLKINLLGVKYTFWGDISAKLTYQILKLGAKEIIYCGKLGALTHTSDLYKRIFSPGKYVIMYHDKVIGKIDSLQHPMHNLFPQIDSGYHVSVPTVLEEDYVQREIISELKINSIDNEISQMAFAVSKFNKEYDKDIKFIALHFATDYIRHNNERAEKTNFDLSNNRSKMAQEKKMEMIEKIGELLIKYL